MQELIGREVVERELRRCLVETLRLDEARVTPDASIMRELGAESLDFLDISYRLEQTFGIKMARHFVLEHAEDLFGEGAALDEEGRLTPAARRLLEIRYAESGLPPLAEDVALEDAAALITVRTMTDTVMAILDTLPEHCACSAAAYTTNGTRVVCGACGQAARFVNGDELIRAWLQQVQAEHGMFAA